MNRLREAEEGLAHQEMGGLVDHHAWGYHYLGAGWLRLGRLDEARRLGERAIECSPCHPGFKAYALHLLGDIATHADGVETESAEAHYRQALVLAESRGMRPLAAQCHHGLGKLYGRVARLEEARTELASAIDLYRAMKMTFWQLQAEAELAKIG